MVGVGHGECEQWLGACVTSGCGSWLGAWVTGGRGLWGTWVIVGVGHADVGHSERGSGRA